jgi:cell division protein FtsB
MIGSGELGRIRRQQVVNLSMTELLLLVVFMAVAFSFLSKEEDLREVSAVQKELELTKAANRSLEAHIRELDEERARLLAKQDELQLAVARLEQQLRELLPDAPPPVANNGPTVTVPESLVKWLHAKVTSLDRIGCDLQSENGALRRQLGGKAPGLPRCIVTSGYLLNLTLLADGSFSGAAAWDEAAQPVASTLPGILYLSSGKTLSPAQFRAAAGELNRWADAQQQSCRFSVKLKRQTLSVETYDQQLNLVETFFYAKRT